MLLKRWYFLLVDLSSGTYTSFVMDKSVFSPTDVYDVMRLKYNSEDALFFSINSKSISHPEFSKIIFWHNHSVGSMSGARGMAANGICGVCVHGKAISNMVLDIKFNKVSFYYDEFYDFNSRYILSQSLGCIFGIKGAGLIDSDGSFISSPVFAHFMRERGIFAFSFSGFVVEPWEGVKAFDVRGVNVFYDSTHTCQNCSKHCRTFSRSGVSSHSILLAAHIMGNKTNNLLKVASLLDAVGINVRNLELLLRDKLENDCSYQKILSEIKNILINQNTIDIPQKKVIEDVTGLCFRYSKEINYERKRK